MARKKRVLVAGLGNLGFAIARELQASGADVIAVDESPARVDLIKDSVAAAVVANSTDRKTLVQLDVRSLDAVVVCIGTEFDAAVLTTVHLVDLQVPRIIARAHSELAANILRKLGAHEVFYVESEMGRAVAHRVLHKNVLKELDLGDDYKVVQASCPAALVGKTLSELRLPDKYDLFVVGIRSAQDGSKMRRPTADTVLTNGDLLLLTGETANVDRFLHQVCDTGA